MIQIKPIGAIVLHELEEALAGDKVWVVDRATDGELVWKASREIAGKYGVVQARREVTLNTGLTAIPSKVHVLQPSNGVDQEQQPCKRNVPWHVQLVKTLKCESIKKGIGTVGVVFE